MSDAEFFRRLDEFVGHVDSKKPFEPVESEFNEIHWGPTPNGGDLSIGFFYDKDHIPCRKEDAVEIHIHEYTKDGRFIQETLGFLTK